MRWKHKEDQVEVDPWPWVKRFAFWPKLIKRHEAAEGQWIWLEPYWERCFKAWIIDMRHWNEMTQRRTADGRLGDVIKGDFIQTWDIQAYLKWRDRLAQKDEEVKAA